MSNVNLCVYAVQCVAFVTTTDYHQKGIFIFKKNTCLYYYSNQNLKNDHLVFQNFFAGSQ